MSEEDSIAKKGSQLLNKGSKVQGNVKSFANSHVGPVHVPTSVFPGVLIAPTMAEVVAVVAVLEILHAVIEALHTAKTNVSAGAGPTARWPD